MMRWLFLVRCVGSGLMSCIVCRFGSSVMGSFMVWVWLVMCSLKVVVIVSGRLLLMRCIVCMVRLLLVCLGLVMVCSYRCFLVLGLCVWFVLLFVMMMVFSFVGMVRFCGNCD